MTKLKTLKDIGNPSDIILNAIKDAIKIEAIKWVKERKKKMIEMKDNPEAFALWCCWMFDYFFNIIKEDLK